MLELAAALLAADPASATIFLDAGAAPGVGDKLRQKDLARTLKAIARHGADGFYRGKVAEALVAASRAGGGLLTAQDLTQYRAIEREPLRCDYRGYQIVSAPPPSSGGVSVCQILSILQGYPLAELGFHSARAVHYQIEAMRHAYVDRNFELGDPAFVDNPLAHLLDRDYAAQIRTRIQPQRRRLGRPQTRAGHPRRQQHHPLFDCRQRRQRGFGHLHAERLVWREGHGERYRGTC